MGNCATKARRRLPYFGVALETLVEQERGDLVRATDSEKPVPLFLQEAFTYISEEGGPTARSLFNPAADRPIVASCIRLLNNMKHPLSTSPPTPVMQVFTRHKADAVAVGKLVQEFLKALPQKLIPPRAEMFMEEAGKKSSALEMVQGCRQAIADMPAINRWTFLALMEFLHTCREWPSITSAEEPDFLAQAFAPYILPILQGRLLNTNAAPDERERSLLRSLQACIDYYPRLLDVELPPALEPLSPPRSP
eukprot:RCo030090